MTMSNELRLYKYALNRARAYTNLSKHGNLITYTGANVTCCIHNIDHNNGIHMHTYNL